MPRDYKSYENARMAKAKRQKALDRGEFRAPSVPHISAAGPTSAPIKADNDENRRLIDAELLRRGIR